MNAGEAAPASRNRRVATATCLGLVLTAAAAYWYWAQGPVPASCRSATAMLIGTGRNILAGTPLLSLLMSSWTHPLGAAICSDVIAPPMPAILDSDVSSH